MEVEPFLLVSTIKVIIAQRLVRKLCKTKEERFLTKSEISILEETVDMNRILDFLKKEKIIAEDISNWSKVPFYKFEESKDCPEGYKGRIGIQEVLKITDTIKELIIKGATAEVIEEQAKKEGMMTMIEDGIFKAVQGVTTIEEVLRVVSE